MNTIAISKQGQAWPSILVKAAMAVSGLGMALWLTLHMLGNLLWLAGPEIMNTYGEKLHGSGVLWPVRLLIVAGLLVHVVGAVLTTRRAQLARPIEYKRKKPVRELAALASRSMRSTGVFLLAFLGYHVASAYGAGHPGFIAGEFHHNLTGLLSSPLHALLLMAATTLITLHLGHGLASSWITLGGESRRRQRLARKLCARWTVFVTVGFVLPTVTYWSGRLLHALA
ncbi:MAG: hypothetical protein ABW321_12645 [Polyangiales bacterium]